MKHHLICESPLCMDLSCYEEIPNWKKDILWYPDEVICGLMPFNHVQKVQKKISRLFNKGTLKYTGRYFTYEMLEKVQIVNKGIRGRNPDYIEGIKTRNGHSLMPRGR